MVLSQYCNRCRMDVEFVESSQIRDKSRKTKTKTRSFMIKNKSCKSCRPSVYKCSVLLKVGFSYYICKDFSELDTLLNHIIARWPLIIKDTRYQLNWLCSLYTCLFSHTAHKHCTVFIMFENHWKYMRSASFYFTTLLFQYRFRRISLH